MKKCILLILLISLPALAQQKRRTTTKPPARPAKKSSVLSRSYWQMGFTGVAYQEEIKTERTGISEEINAQSVGLGLSVRYIKPTKSIRWIQSHAAEFSTGFLRMQGVTASLNDELKNQPWMSVTVTPGMSYRTTSVSEVGLGIPLTYRIINWKVADPTYKVDRASSFSYGLTGTFTNHFSLKNSLLVSMSHHVAWNSTVWSAGWIHSFR